MWDWFKQRKSGWSNFYLFLEDIAQTAKMQLISESIRSALSGDQGDKTKCSSCNKYHSGKCNKPKNAAALNQGGENSCPVCNKPHHKCKTNISAEGVSKRVMECPDFKATNDDQKQEMVKKVKSRLPICNKCTAWSHKLDVCFWK